jgi:hypothetical protein
MISPLIFLGVIVAGTIGVALWAGAGRKIKQQKLMKLARDWRMHYAADDRFGLAPRVAERLLLPGSAGVRVVDLIYGTEEGIRRYVFSARYSLGVIAGKRRISCVASMSEDCTGPIGVWSAMKVAKAEGGIIEQYKAVGEKEETALGSAVS